MCGKRIYITPPSAASIIDTRQDGSIDSRPYLLHVAAEIDSQVMFFQSSGPVWVSLCTLEPRLPVLRWREPTATAATVARPLPGSTCLLSIVTCRYLIYCCLPVWSFCSDLSLTQNSRSLDVVPAAAGSCCQQKKVSYIHCTLPARHQTADR